MACTCVRWSTLKLVRVNGPSTTLSTRWSRIGTSGSRGMVARFAFTQRRPPRKYLKRLKPCWEIPRKRIQTSSNACSKQLMIGCKSVMLVRAPNTAMTSSCSGERKTVSGSKMNSWGLGKTHKKKRTRTTLCRLGRAWGTSQIKKTRLSLTSPKVWCWKQVTFQATLNSRCRLV